jgi:hypothetical protein
MYCVYEQHMVWVLGTQSNDVPQQLVVVVVPGFPGPERLFHSSRCVMDG